MQCSNDSDRISFISMFLLFKDMRQKCNEDRLLYAKRLRSTDWKAG